MNTLSVLIVTKDRPTELQACLRSVLAQVPLPLEVVIIDQSRGPGRTRIAELFQSSGVPFHYAHEPTLSGLTQARNRAAALTSGTILLFLDDDVELAPGYIREMLAVFDNDRLRRVGGAGGLIVNFSRALSTAQRIRSWVFYRGPFCIERDAVNFHFHPGDHPRHALRLYGCNMAFRRQVMDELQFDEGYSGYSFGEDRDFSVLVARRFILQWVPSAHLVHKQSPGNRLSHERSCELRVLSWARFYERCTPKTFASLICYIWLNIGFLVLLMVFWDPSTVRGTYRAFRRLLAIALRRAKLSEALQEGWRPGST